MKKLPMLLLAAILIGCGGGGGGSDGGGSQGPVVGVTTGTSVDGTTAALEGSVNPNGVETSAWFEWGTDPALSGYKSTPAVGVGSGNSARPITATLSGLDEGTTYYFRVAARNSRGTTRGSIGSVLAHVRKWGNAILIENEAGDIPTYTDPVSYKVAASPAGDAIAVWLQWDGTKYGIRANRFTAADNSWSGAAPLEAAGAGDASFPRIAMDNDGSAIAAWRQEIDNRERIVVDRYSASGKVWTGARTVDIAGEGLLDDPDVAMSASGDAIVAWTRYLGGKFGILAARYSADTDSWSGPVQLLPDIAGEGGNARVAMSAKGDAIAIWEEETDTKSSIRARYFSAAGDIWSAADTIMEFDPIGSNRSSRIAMSAGGDAVVACAEFDTGRVWANRYSAANAAWSGPTALESSSLGSAWDPDVAMSAGGDAIVIWRLAIRVPGDFNNVTRASRYSAVERGWSGAVYLEPTGAGNSVGANIDMAPNGDAVVGWAHADNVLYGSVATRYSAADNAWSGAVPVESDDVNASASPAVAISAAGEAVAVFTKKDGERWDLWANRTH